MEVEALSKTRKVMDIQTNGVWIKVIRKESEKYNKYCVYSCWYDMGEHRRLVAKYANMQSVLLTLAQLPQFRTEG